MWTIRFRSEGIVISKGGLAIGMVKEIRFGDRTFDTETRLDNDWRRYLETFDGPVTIVRYKLEDGKYVLDEVDDPIEYETSIMPGDWKVEFGRHNQPDSLSQAHTQ